MLPYWWILSKFGSEVRIWSSYLFVYTRCVYTELVVTKYVLSDLEFKFICVHSMCVHGISCDQIFPLGLLSAG